MKLLYDLTVTQPNPSGKVHGGGKYGIVVFLALAERGAKIEAVYDSRCYIRPDILDTARSRSIRLYDLATTNLDEIFRQSEATAYYSAADDLPAIPQDVRKICTVHGLRGLEVPRDWMMLRYRTGFYQSIRTGVTLIFNKWWKGVLHGRFSRKLLEPGLEYVTVSEHTKYACLSYFPMLNAADIKVCYSPSTSSVRTDVEPYQAGHPYVLIVSGNRPEKNALRALKALDEIFSQHPEQSDMHVMVTGATPRSYFWRPRNKERFHFLGYVEEATLESLYCGARMLVYPSLNEGFGYPPLEAMRFGVPVTAAAITSIPEVCGDAALYFNPLDYHEIKSRILRMLTDPECHAQYSEAGTRRFEEVTRRQKRDLDQLLDILTSDRP